MEYKIAPTGEITRPDGSVLKPEELPAWDWARNGPVPGTESPYPVEYSIAPTGEIKRPDGSSVNPEDYPGWDWARNRPVPGVGGPMSVEFEVGPNGEITRPDGTPVNPDDYPAWDWNRNRPIPLVDEPAFDFEAESPDDAEEEEVDWMRNPSQVPPEEEPAFDYDRAIPEEDENHPEFDWMRQQQMPVVAPPSEPAFDFDRSQPAENMDQPPPEEGEPAFVFENDSPNHEDNDQRAPWAMTPDDDTDDGRGPKPMNVPEDLWSEPTEEEKEQPKGTVIPVWMMLTLAVVASVLGAGSVTPPGTPVEQPPFLPPGAVGDRPLPALPDAPAVPCAQDAACGFIMGAIDPVFPPQTRALINVPGTCQNWAREWLRTGKDIMEFQVERIRQRFSMALIYCEFNGDNWLEGELWVSDLHECDWYTMIGVDPCGRHEQYQILRNYGQQMRGTLPPEISMMSSLWEITFSDNLLTGTIPTDFAKLSELDTFSLSFNLFKGTIPQFMWEFEDMIHLDLGYNFFTGTIPDTVDQTEPHLRDLFLENNELNGNIPTTFGNLDWARLHLDGNKFEGPVPENINAGKMRELMLHNNKLTGEFPASSFANEYTGRRSKLEKVTIYHNDIEGDVNEMCKLKTDPTIGKLETFIVDPEKVACDCCDPVPV